ncbi:MAG: tetratricopeptide repeat protein, partial [Croceibacterium sp.]
GRPQADVAAYLGAAELVQGELDDARRWLAPGRFSAASRQRGFHALGRLNLEEGNLPAAAVAFNQALASGKPTAQLWFDIGAMRYRGGEQHLALNAAERAVALEPQNPGTLRFRAQLARDAEGMVAALPWFERALQGAPDDVDLLGEYAATLGDAGQNRAMLAVARRMVELSPRDPRAFYLQAVLAVRAGWFDMARRLMWQTGGAYDAKPSGLLLNGVLELASGNPALAVEQFDTLVRQQPQNHHAALLLGRALLANGESNEVIARFTPADDRRHAAPYLLALVGQAHEQLGNRAKAANYLDRATAPPGDVVTVLPVDAAGDFAIWRWQKDNSDPQGAVALLRRLVASRQTGEAQAEATRLLTRFPGSADIERLAGDVFLLTGDSAGALAAYDRSGAIRSDHALVRRTILAERALGRGAAAERRGGEFIARNPRSLPALRVQALAAAARRDWRNAEPLLRRASALAGESDPLLLAALAEGRLALGQPQAALADARRAHSLQRANRRITAVLARVIKAAKAG